MTTRRARGIDISSYQKQFTPTEKRKGEIDFLILRASKNNIGDKKFEDFYTQSLNYPIRGAYHYYTTTKTESSKLIPKDRIKPRIFNHSEDKAVINNGLGQVVKEVQIKTVSGRGVSWQKQADFFLEKVEGKEFNFLALDLEKGKNPRKWIGLTKNIFTESDIENIEQWIDYVREAAKIPVLVYTRPVFLRDVMIPLGGDKLKNMDLWLAFYGKKGEVIDSDRDTPYKKYSIPGVSQSHWRLWQYSADKNGLGSEFGVKTSGIDLDVFNGTIDEMKDWLAGKGVKKETGAVDELEVPAPAANQMEWIITQLEKLIKAGIKPNVEINIGGTLFDVNKLKSLKEILEKEGIFPEVNLSVDMSANGDKHRRSTIPVDTTHPKPKTPTVPEDPSPKPEDSMTVRAFSKTKKFVPLWILGKSTDEVGKPDMVKTNPVIRIPVNRQFGVDPKHKISSKDKNGKIKATDGNLYYRINYYSENADAIGKYVLKDSVKPV